MSLHPFVLVDVFTDRPLAGNQLSVLRAWISRRIRPREAPPVPMGAYLVSRNVVAEGTAFVVEQGDEAGRPSRIEVRVSGDTVKVGGRCVIVGEGRLTFRSLQ